MGIFRRRFDEQQIRDTIAELVMKCRFLEKRLDQLNSDIKSMKEYERRVSYNMNSVAEELARLAKFHEPK